MPLPADAIDVCNLISLVNDSANSTTVNDSTQNDSDIKAVLEGLENPRVVQVIARGISNLMSNCNESAMSPLMPPIMPTNHVEAGLAQTTTNALCVGGVAPHATLPLANNSQHYRRTAYYFPSTPTFTPSPPQAFLPSPDVIFATPQFTATTLKRSASTAFSTNSDSVATFGVYPCGWQNCGHLFTISHKFIEDLRTHLREAHYLAMGLRDPLIACQWSSCRLTEKIPASMLVTHIFGPHMKLNQGCKFCGTELFGAYALSKHFQTCRKAKRVIVGRGHPAAHATSKRVRVN